MSGQLLKPGKKINSEAQSLAQSYPAGRGRSGTRIQFSTLQNHGSWFSLQHAPSSHPPGRRGSPCSQPLGSSHSVTASRSSRMAVMVSRRKYTWGRAHLSQGKEGLGSILFCPCLQLLAGVQDRPKIPVFNTKEDMQDVALPSPRYSMGYCPTLRRSRIRPDLPHPLCSSHLSPLPCSP